MISQENKLLADGLLYTLINVTYKLKNTEGKQFLRINIKSILSTRTSTAFFREL